MTVRTTNLGGTNWSTDEVLTSVDLNDTMNAMANLALAQSVFWLNTNTRELYDDFDSYTTDAAVPSTLWTTSGSGGTYRFYTRASTNAGGSSKEGELYAYINTTATSYCLTKTNTLTSNAHKYAKVYSSIGGSSNQSLGTGTTEVSFNKGTNYDTIGSLSASNSDGEAASQTSLGTIMVIAKGSDEYDCYIGGKLIRTVTDATFQLWFRAVANFTGSTGSIASTLFIDDVYESTGTV